MRLNAPGRVRGREVGLHSAPVGPEALALLFAAATALLGGRAAYWSLFSEAAKVRRVLREARRVDVADAKPDDVVKIVGRVLAVTEPLRSPLGGRECVFFETTVERYHYSGRGGAWRPLVRETDAVDFLLEDRTGRIAVRANDMRALSINDVWLELDADRAPPAAFMPFLNRHGLLRNARVSRHHLRFREGAFTPGERVAVIGVVRWERDPNPTTAGSGYRDAPRRLVVQSRPNGPLLATDKPEATEAPEALRRSA